MIVDAANWLLLIAGLIVFGTGLAKLTFIPLALVGEAQRASRDASATQTILDRRPLVTVVVPAFNEEKVLVNCVQSILRSAYPEIEVVLVDDGSTDETFSLMTALATTDDRVRAFTQANAGKGAALNRGIEVSGGEILMFVDADGIFRPDTVSEMLRGFHHSSVGAVCGDDRPINLDRILTRLLTILSHVGTSLVRRALVVIHSLLIVSGNMGAFPRSVIEEVGGFREDTVGEDLELTWRVQLAGYQVEFRPTATVYAESPSTVRGLWRQRVRWARGLLQTMRIHRRAIGNPKYGAFGLYLAFNSLNAVVVPILQLLLIVGLPLMFLTGNPPFALSWLGFVAWLGLLVSLVIVLIAITMNRAFSDLKYIWTILLWPAYSIFMAAVMVAALWAERKGEPAAWNKLERTGVVSIDGLLNAPQAAQPIEGAQIDADPEAAS